MTNRPRTNYGRKWRLRGQFALYLVTSLLVGGTAPLLAREQSEEFVAGLRERGLFALTNDYLSQMETSKLADTDFRQRISLLRGLTLLDEARQTPDRDKQAALLQKARIELES